MTNTLVISGLKLLFGFLAPIVLALLINEVRNTAFKRTVQTISYLPHFLSMVIVAGLVVGGVSAVGYLGFVIGPSVVGWTAAAFGLRGGLVILAVAAAFVAIAPRTVPSITSQPQEPAAPGVS